MLGIQYLLDTIIIINTMVIDIFYLFKLIPVSGTRLAQHNFS